MKDSRFPLLLRSDVNIYTPQTRATDMYYIDHVIVPNRRPIEDIQFKMDKIDKDIDKHKMDEHKMDKIDIDINELTMDVKKNNRKRIPTTNRLYHIKHDKRTVERVNEWKFYL